MTPRNASRSLRIQLKIFVDLLVSEKTTLQLHNCFFFWLAETLSQFDDTRLGIMVKSYLILGIFFFRADFLHFLLLLINKSIKSALVSKDRRAWKRNRSLGPVLWWPELILISSSLAFLLTVSLGEHRAKWWKGSIYGSKWGEERKQKHNNKKHLTNLKTGKDKIKPFSFRLFPEPSNANQACSLLQWSEYCLSNNIQEVHVH